MKSAARRFMTPSEVARALGVSVATVRLWHRQGILAGERLPSGHRRFCSQDVEALRASPPMGGNSDD